MLDKPIFEDNKIILRQTCRGQHRLRGRLVKTIASIQVLPSLLSHACLMPAMRVSIIQEARVILVKDVPDFTSRSLFEAC